MTRKEEKTKTEMKNADKQGAGTGQGWGLRSPWSHQTSDDVTSDLRIHRDLTSQTLTGCSQHRHYKYLSDDENVRRRPSTNNKQDLSKQFRQ